MIKFKKGEYFINCIDDDGMDVSFYEDSKKEELLTIIYGISSRFVNFLDDVYAEYEGAEIIPSKDRTFYHDYDLFFVEGDYRVGIDVHPGMYRLFGNNNDDDGEFEIFTSTLYDELISEGVVASGDYLEIELKEGTVIRLFDLELYQEAYF